MSDTIANAYQARVLDAINYIGQTRNNSKIGIITGIIIKISMLFTIYNPLRYI